MRKKISCGQGPLSEVRWVSLLQWVSVSFHGQWEGVFSYDQMSRHPPRSQERKPRPTYPLLLTPAGLPGHQGLKRM